MLGLQMPQDISVIGFNDINITEHIDLTTVSQSLKGSGQMAVELLLGRLTNPGRPIQHIQIQVQLKVRGTTRRI